MGALPLAQRPTPATEAVPSQVQLFSGASGPSQRPRAAAGQQQALLCKSCHGLYVAKVPLACADFEVMEAENSELDTQVPVLPTLWSYR